MKDTWGEEIPEHAPHECYPCNGSGFYKLPIGAPPEEAEDEANCECECHASNCDKVETQAG